MKNFFVLMTLSLSLLVGCDNDKKEDADDKDKMTSGTESQEEKNKQTALASINAIIAGDVDGALKDAAPDVTDYGDGSMPAVKSVDSIRVGLNMWRGSMSEYKADKMWAIADGDYVAVFGDWTSTFKSDLMGMKTTGKTVKIKDVDIFKFNDEGKITEHRNIQSSAEMMKQLGIEMPK